MAVDHIRYDILAQEALRGLVRSVLTDAAKNGLPGDHHFFVTFDTQAVGVRLSSRLLAQYPEEMTIVLQHQFWDLKVSDDGFEVRLSFGGVAERVYLPFSAIKSFADPSVQFMLQFETLDEASEPDNAPAQAPAEHRDDSGEETTPVRARPRREPKRPSPSTPPSQLPAPEPAPAVASDHPAPPPDKPAGGQVVRLDRFRKK